MNNQEQIYYVYRSLSDRIEPKSQAAAEGHIWRRDLGPRNYHSKYCKANKAASTVAPAWLAILTPAPVNSSWPVGAADCVALDELFDDGKARIEPEATAA
jgi:hypothetical protein